MIPQHSSKSWEHFSPPLIVQAARITMGGIDLDPASCAEANQIVRADEFFGVSDDGLSKRWHGRTWLNPPGGSFVLTDKDAETMGAKRATAYRARLSEESQRWETKSRACAWWRKLVEEFDSGHLRSAVFLGFTLEILRTSQGGRWATPLDFPFCVPRERLEFSGTDPTHGNVIVYLGGHPRRFRAQFERFGVVTL